MTDQLQQVSWLLAELEQIDEPTADDAVRADELIGQGTLLRWLDAERGYRAEQAAFIRKAAERSSEKAVEYHIPNVATRRDPFDLDSLPFSASGPEVRGRAETAIERMGWTDDNIREQCVRVLHESDDLRGSIAKRYLATGSDLYREAFSKAVRGQHLTTDEGAVLDRAQSLTDAAGGYAVPFTLDPTIILTNDGTNNPVRQISRTVRITTDSWNGVSSAGATASWDAEAAEVSDDAITLAQPSVPVYKGQAFVPFSVEVGGDWAGFESDIRMVIQDAKDRLEAAAFTTGTGSAQPTGIITAIVADTPITSATTDVFAIADVYSTLEGTGPRYRSNSSWMANLAVINDMRTFATANNYHAFLTDLTGGNPSQLLGRPLYENSDMDGSHGTGDNYILINGDFSNFVIADRVGMSIELVPHLFATANNLPSGQRGFLAWWRVGSDSVNDAAFTLLNVT